MKAIASVMFVLWSGLVASAQDKTGNGDFTIGPDYDTDPDLKDKGSPKGQAFEFSMTLADSKIFPGTIRDYWVYVPTQYRPGRPAPFMVFQDGAGFISDSGSWRAPIVFDNLIHKREMPPTIGIFNNSGRVDAGVPVDERVAAILLPI